METFIMHISENLTNVEKLILMGLIISTFAFFWDFLFKEYMFFDIVISIELISSLILLFVLPIKFNFITNIEIFIWFCYLIYSKYVFKKYF